MIATNLVCPDCGGRLDYRKRGKYGPWYACTRWPECPGAHGAHPDGSPMGTPADRPTREARVAAHLAFDVLWTPGSDRRGKRRRRRQRMYARLRAHMHIRKEDAHISHFTIAQCAIVIEFAAMVQAEQDEARHQLRAAK